MVCYEILPLDTLFFRGNTPMEAGQMVCESLFPPPASVCIGAIRSELMKQNDIALNRTNGEKILFDIEAVLVKKDNRLYSPWPANWFIEVKNYEKKVIFAQRTSILNHPLKIQCSEGDVALFKEDEGHEVIDTKSLWIDINLLGKENILIEDGDCLCTRDIYSLESRTGIGLDFNKHVKDGMLYTANHIRLNEGVSLIFCLSREPSYEGKVLQEKGILQLGGEKRLCSYKKIEDIVLPNMSQYNYSYVPVEASAENLAKIVSSGKITTTSGWDLDKEFHKATTNWIPAGAVFTEKV